MKEVESPQVPIWTAVRSVNHYYRSLCPHSNIFLAISTLNMDQMPFSLASPTMAKAFFMQACHSVFKLPISDLPIRYFNPSLCCKAFIVQITILKEPCFLAHAGIMNATVSRKYSCELLAVWQPFSCSEFNIHYYLFVFLSWCLMYVVIFHYSNLPFFSLKDCGK